MDWKDTPIFINNNNNLERGFRGLVNWLQQAGMTRVMVIDNHSTYEPLLEYYNQTRLEGVYLSENHGHLAFWKLGLYKSYERFILADPDCVPCADCPKDLVWMMHEVMNMYNVKVGTGLRIDNLPNCYDRKQEVISRESKYWQSRKDKYCFNASIDTTFALYSKDWNTHFPGHQHLRLDFPYVVEHIPWYEDSSKKNEEKEFYKAHAIPGISSW